MQFTNTKYGMDILLKRIILEYAFLLLMLILCVSAAADFYTSSSQLIENEKTDYTDNVVLEGNCVVVCDADSLPDRSMASSVKTESRLENKIAFTAIRNEDNMYIGKDNIIKFDFVIVNRGNAYNKQTSTFTAPVNGVYMFEFTVFKHYSRSYSLTIALTVRKSDFTFSRSREYRKLLLENC